MFILSLLQMVALICFILAFFIKPEKLIPFIPNPKKSKAVLFYFLVAAAIGIANAPATKTKDIQKESTPSVTQSTPQKDGAVIINLEDEPRTAPLIREEEFSEKAKEKPQVENTKKIAKQEIKNEDAQIKKEYAALYKELLGFKNNSTFHRVGFGQGGAYHNWLKRVQAAENKYSKEVVFRTGLFFGELGQMGREYMRSKGAETEYTLYMKKELKVHLGK